MKMLIVKFVIAICITLAFVSIIAGVYNCKPISQLER